MTYVNQFNQKLDFEVPNWQGALYPPHTSIFGLYSMLEPLNLEKHAHSLFESLLFNNQGETWTYLYSKPIFNFDDFIVYLKEKLIKPDFLPYAILDLSTKKVLGTAAYHRIVPEHGVIEVGHLHFSKLLQRTRIATEAMYLMMYRVFEELKYRRYEWKCHTFNEPSRQAALRLGFTFEGIFRQMIVIDNRNRDTAWFSIIDSEWPPLKKRFETWLHPNNFDSNGRQKKKLLEC